MPACLGYRAVLPERRHAPLRMRSRLRASTAPAASFSARPATAISMVISRMDVRAEPRAVTSTRSSSLMSSSLMSSSLMSSSLMSSSLRLLGCGAVLIRRAGLLAATRSMTLRARDCAWCYEAMPFAVKLSPKPCAKSAFIVGKSSSNSDSISRIKVSAPKLANKRNCATRPARVNDSALPTKNARLS